MLNKVICKIVDFPCHEQGHSHPHGHIIVPMDKPVKLTHDGHSYTLSAGYMSFILPHSYHRFCGQTHKDIIVMDIPETMIKKKDYAAFSANRILPVDQMLMPLMELIRHEIITDPCSDSVRYLFYYIYDKFVARQSFKSLKYIADNYAENITVAKLAQIENYNRFYYTDWFKSKTGVLPSEYIQTVRIEKAKALLSHTKYKITEVAHQVGYDNSSSFTRVFKKLEHCSPREYRNLSRTPPNKKEAI